MASPVITLILDAKNLASPQLKGLQKDLRGAETTTTKMNAAMSRGAMIAKGALVAGFAAAGFAAAKFVADGVRGAIEEEQSIARLDAALASNVKGWEGQTQAIDKAIRAGERKAFSDDDVRASLTRLVGATKDVGKANEMMAVAMDLARFKGISLEDASTALIKVEGGQYRALKELGIVLRDGATATEALAEVQRVAGGQASAYADTLAGKAEILSIRMDNLGETVGMAVVPALDTAATSILGFGDAMDTAMNGDFQEQFDLLGAYADMIGGPWGDKLRQGADDIKAQRDAINQNAYAWDTGSERIGVAMGQVAADSAEMRGRVLDNNRKIKLSFGSVTEYLLGQYNADFDRAMGIQEARADLHNAKTDEDRVRAYETLAELGAASQKDYAKWLAALERMSKDAKGQSKKAIDAAIAHLKLLRDAAKKPINVKVNYRHSATGKIIEGTIGGKASGGWVGLRGPEMRWVGEAGPEYIVPNHDIGGPSGGMTGGGGGGGVTLVVNSAWPPTPAQAREFANAIDAEWSQRRARYGD